MTLALAFVAVGCTEFRPIAWDDQTSWARARQTAYLRAKAPVPPTARALGPQAGDASRQASAPRSLDRPPETGAMPHLVRPGDTVSEIALAYGVPQSELLRVNGLGSPDRIYIGRVLWIPEVSSLPSQWANDPSGGVIQVAPGDRLADLARQHGVSAEALARANGVAVDAPLETGQVLALPSRLPSMAVALVPVVEPDPGREALGRKAANTPPPALSGVGFMWPVDGPLVEGGFEKSPGYIDNGVNIEAAAGTPILAAENGVVVYADDEMSAYGNMVVIRHDGDYTTAYGHAGDLRVGLGQVVRRGDVLGHVGLTGLVDRPQLYFEMRIGSRVVDPARYLDNKALAQR